ncbi:MAG: hypothetical protein PHF20_10585 [Halothiobacillaceae bacterium]|nr:hypothetical protein [Halothiobacillaceae bacterium]
MNTASQLPSAFDDLDAALNRIRLAADALNGIGNLLQPETSKADEQLNMARRHDASAVFEFFGEVLGESREIASEACETIQREAERLHGNAAKGGAA